MAFGGVKGVPASRRKVTRLIKGVVEAFPGATEAQDLLISSIRDLQGQEESGILTQGIDEAIRLRTGSAQRQAEAGAGLGGAARINPNLAAQQISAGLIQREQIRVQNEQRREAIISQRLGLLTQQTSGAFTNPVASVLSASAAIRTASIAGLAELEKARLEKGNELLGFASGVLQAAGTAVGGM